MAAPSPVNSLPDFEDHFQCHKFSDVELEIYEETANLGKKRKRGRLLPGHSMVLMGFSSYCKTKLDNWTPEDDVSTAADRKAKKSTRKPSSVKYKLELAVPPGQTEIAVQLIKAMYQRTPQLSELTQEQLLQLLMLADRFEVPKVQTAVLDVFRAVSVEQLQWDTALTLLCLPASCAEQEGCKDICELAVQKLQQKLGDLDEAWADQQLQELLLALPHAALLRLLQHNDTRVISECTVVHSILQWHQRQTGSGSLKRKQLQKLMQQVRMQHLSQMYICTIMMRSPGVLLCYSAQELGIACMCTSSYSLKALQEAESAELIKYPAWTAAKRPASNQQQVLSWQLALSEVKDTAERFLHQQEAAFVRSPVTVLQGRTVHVEVVIQKSLENPSASSNSDTQVDFGLFFHITDQPDGGVSQASIKFIMDTAVTADVAATGTQVHQGQSIQKKLTARGFGCGDLGWGLRQMLNLGPITSGAEVEEVLRNKKLVHPDGTLHLKAEIVDML